MSDTQDKDIQLKQNPETAPEEQAQAIKTSEFMKETIKQRPINKRRLLRRLIITVGLAVIFGLVACLTFLFLEPIINQRMNPKEENPQEQVEQVKFVEETVEEETKPEDMIAVEAELQPVIIEQTELDDEQIEQVLNKMELGIDDYLSLSESITEIAKIAQSSIVSVVGITQDKDWFDNTYADEDISSGVIIADNGRDLLILTNLGNFKSTDSIEIDLADGSTYPGELLMKDNSTNLGVVSLLKSMLDTQTADSLSIMELGVSSNKELNGMPVIAIGRPMGSEQSLGIGRITSCTSVISLADGDYKQLTTDIYGSPEATGVLINTNGLLIGIIDMEHNSPDMSNMISAYGISELKKLIEIMSNGNEIPYLGLYGKDVTSAVSSSMEIPQGIYITKMEMNSPLMNAGIQSGDIITEFNGISVATFREINNLRLNLSPEDEIKVEVMRQGLDGYTPLEYDVVIGYQNN